MKRISQVLRLKPPTLAAAADWTLFALHLRSATKLKCAKDLAKESNS